MTNLITIRPAQPTDAETLAAYNVAMARETESLALDPATVLAGVRAALSDPSKGRYFVADTGDRVVGQLMIFPEWSDWRNGEIWWIASVYTHPDFRGKGVFKSLYRFVRQLARTEHAIGLRLYVEKENSPAQQTYMRLGMSKTHYDVMEELF